MGAAVNLDFPDSHYNPETGRFLSEDPIGFGGLDANLYRYVGNNPVNFVDPNGEVILNPPTIIAALKFLSRGILLFVISLIEICRENPGVYFFCLNDPPPSPPLPCDPLRQSCPPPPEDPPICEGQ